MADNTTTTTLKLNGDNWPIWKFQTSIILKGRGLFEIADGSRIKPSSGDELNKWLKDDAKTQELLVTRMEEGPLTHLLSCESAKEMWTKLKTVYDKESVVSVHLLQQRFFMLDFDSSVNTFISKIEEIKTKLKTAGEVLSDKMIITKILMTLPEHFKHFRSAWESVPDKNQTLEELTSRLLLEEERCKTVESTTALVSKTSSQNNPTKKCYICAKAGHIAKNCYFRTKNSKNDKADKTNKFCSYCRKQGHLVQTCWIKKKKEEPSNKNPVKEEVEHNAFMVYSDGVKSGDWYLDSGATEHMTWDRSLFEKMFEDRTPRMVQVGNGQTLEVRGYGNIKMWSYNGRKFIETSLSNVLYIPDLKFNLFSAGCALDKGYFMSSDNSSCKFFDKYGNIRAQALRQNKLYKMQFKKEMYENKIENELTNNISECMTVKNIENLETWHHRLAHQNIKYIKDFLKKMNVEYINNEFICEYCLSGKQHKLKFQHSESRATVPLELVHADVCGPMETPSLGGARYFLLFKDDYTSYRHVYFLKQKSEVAKAIENYISMAERQTGAKMKVLRTDNGLEFVNKQVTECLQSRGICHQRTVVYTPQQNGRAERENRTLVEAARTMLHSNKNLTKMFWAEAINTATYVLNRSGPSIVQFKTPFELWNQKEYKMENFNIFGSRVSVLVPKENRLKWDTKNEQGYFLGYGEDTKGFRVYLPDKNKVVIQRDVIFLPEKVQETKGKITEFCNIEENQDLELEDTQIDNIVHDEETITDEEELDPEISEEIVNGRYNLRRNLRGNPRFEDFEMDLDSLLLTVTEDDEPTCYEDAMKSVEAEQWRKAMEEEVKSLQENESFEVVCDSDVKRPVIECKWVYKRKKDEFGSVTKFKARLVAKGFQQTIPLNGDIYSPVAKLTSVRIFLAICNNLNFRIHQLDVCSAFLNGEIDDDVYILLPKGFNTDTGKFAKLRKSLYGLRSSPKNWYKKFNDLMMTLNFVRSQNEYCIYYKISGCSKIFVLIYVDDLLIAGSDEKEVDDLKVTLNQHFKMKDLGGISYFLGMHITQNVLKNEIIINQTLYLKKMLKIFKMENCKPCNTPMEPNFRHDDLKRKNSESIEIEERCRAAIGSIMYAMLCSRPDLCISISILSRYQSTASSQLWQSIKRVLRYVQKTQNLSLVFRKTDFQNEIEGYADADWAGDRTDRKSTSGYVFKVFGCTVSWCSRKQSSVALSSTEAEYIALSLAISEACWLKSLISDLKICDSLNVMIYEDNQSAIKVCRNPEFHKRLKHIDIRYHFIRDKINDKTVSLKYIPTKLQLADLFTKPLSLSSFNNFTINCNVF